MEKIISYPGIIMDDKDQKCAVTKKDVLVKWPDFILIFHISSTTGKFSRFSWTLLEDAHSTLFVLLSRKTIAIQ